MNPLEIVIKGDVNDALDKIGGVKGALGGLGNVAKGALTVGLGAAALGVGALAAEFAVATKSAMEAQDVEAKLAAVLKSTKGAAGLTATEIKKMATSLQAQTKFGDEAILSGQNLLLTFTGIGKEVFPQATKTMLDMSEALGQDMKSSALQLGKALNDPVQGVSALSRVGVSFTDQQKEQIKTLVESGNKLKAQKIILAELKTEFGGAAKAAGDTFGGKIAQLENIIDDVHEKIGTALLPILTTVAEKAKEFLTSDGFVKFIDGIAGGLEKLASGDVKGVLADIFGAEVANNLATFAGNVKDFADVTLPKLETAIRTAFDGGLQAISDFWENAQPALQDFQKWLQTDGVDALQVFYAKARESQIVGAELKNLWTEMSTTFKLAMKDTKDNATTELPSLAQIVGATMDEINTDTLTKLTVFRDVFRTINAGLRGDWEQVWKVELPNLLSDGYVVLARSVGVNGQMMLDIQSKSLETLVEFAFSIKGKLGEAGSAMMQGLIEGMRQRAADVQEALSDIIVAAVNQIKQYLGIASPSKVFAGIGANMALGLEQGFGAPNLQFSAAGVGTMPSGTLKNANGEAFNAVGVGGTSSHNVTNNVYITAQVRSDADIDRLADKVSERLGVKSRHRITTGF